MVPLPGAMMSKTGPLRVPELLQEIALFIENAQNLSCLAQVDRFTHRILTPCLFRSIKLRLHSLGSLATAFRNNPDLAASCKSLTFFCEYGQRESVVSGSAIQQLCMDVIVVFGAISTHQRLASLRLDGWEFKGHIVDISEEAAAAVSSVLGSLQELEMYIPFESHIWNSLTSTRFAQLRVFRLSLLSAHGWDCSSLQQMLNTLCHLEELALEFPVCCGPFGLTLGSTHPHLKRFSFTGCALMDECDFLARHPSLESLYLETDQSFSNGTDSSPLKMLRALSINGYSLCYCPTLLNSPITHLRLREIDEEPDPALADTIRALGRTLRCLELDVEGLEDEPIPQHAIDLMSNAPALDELAIIRHRPSPLPHNWASNLITDLLAALGPTTPIRALRVRCDDALPQTRLRGLGPLPVRLKYIGWDVGRASSVVYSMERRPGDEDVFVNTVTRAATDDWMAEAVLPFMGESWTP
ncbi:hypothetical protein MVEN_01592700 [Mycena venus]|uniref:F-box domain-containing protein n=1 Tax=Mycena venus TaxID=2733690 RepID=A0A8H6XSR2_9AGAR|nr:hypothetical protein MVEN_01592700 [Mycena venus]